MEKVFDGESNKPINRNKSVKKLMEKTGNKHLLKAYDNPKFLRSADARPIRILSEYLEPLYRLRKKKIKDTVVFYGSARTLSMAQAKDNLAQIKWKYSRSTPENKELFEKKLNEAQHELRMAKYYEDARELAYRLTKWSLELEENQRFIVCSGGGPGIMEAANRGAAEANGPTIGMNISIPSEQFPNPYITEDLSFEFHYFFMRKFWFVYMAKGLVVFPGGFGTFDELFELITLRQTGKISKPLCVVIYGREYWDSVIDFDRMVDWGVISESDLKLFHLVDTVDEAFDTLRHHFERHFVGKKKYWHL